MSLYQSQCPHIALINSQLQNNFTNFGPLKLQSKWFKCYLENRVTGSRRQFSLIISAVYFVQITGLLPSNVRFSLWMLEVEMDVVVRWSPWLELPLVLEETKQIFISNFTHMVWCKQIQTSNIRNQNILLKWNTKYFFSISFTQKSAVGHF